MVWFDVLKALPKLARNRIENIMDDGKERTAEQIIDALLDERERSNTSEKNFRTGHDIPTAIQIAHVLGRDSNYVKRRHQNKMKYTKVK